jgi:hypothetical protein
MGIPLSKSERFDKTWRMISHAESASAGICTAFKAGFMPSVAGSEWGITNFRAL